MDGGRNFCRGSVTILIMFFLSNNVFEQRPGYKCVDNIINLLIVIKFIPFSFILGQTKLVRSGKEFVQPAFSIFVSRFVVRHEC